jgi:pilus assembly protein TadC
VRRRLLASVAAGSAVAVILGGLVGVVAGVVVAALAERGLRRLEPAQARRRRECLTADVPATAELLAACLAAGAPLGRALEGTAVAIGGPLQEVIDGVQASIRLGADPAEAWESAAHQPELAALARALARSSRSGAPAADVLAALAEDLRERRRAAASAAAQRVGVQAVAPLAVCFLPAFVLLGVVPVVLSLAGQLFAGLR